MKIIIIKIIIKNIQKIIINKISLIVLITFFTTQKFFIINTDVFNEISNTFKNIETNFNKNIIEPIKDLSEGIDPRDINVQANNIKDSINNIPNSVDDLQNSLTASPTGLIPAAEILYSDILDFTNLTSNIINDFLNKLTPEKLNTYFKDILNNKPNATYEIKLEQQQNLYNLYIKIKNNLDQIAITPIINNTLTLLATIQNISYSILKIKKDLKVFGDIIPDIINKLIILIHEQIQNIRLALQKIAISDYKNGSELALALVTNTIKKAMEPNSSLPQIKPIFKQNAEEIINSSKNITSQINLYFRGLQDTLSKISALISSLNTDFIDDFKKLSLIPLAQDLGNIQNLSKNLSTVIVQIIKGIGKILDMSGNSIMKISELTENARLFANLLVKYTNTRITNNPDSLLDLEKSLNKIGEALTKTAKVL